ncbi:MAG TPA: zf-HC2 domain-containing protein [Blastocatellia bacterium]|nr:zf-HC2 domain-containing protein [Blastocatellia bacterium]
MKCERCQEKLSDYVDGALELGEQVQIERHLADCEPCRIVRDDLLQIVHFSRQLPLHTPSGAVWTRIQSGIVAEQKAGLQARAARWWEHFRGRKWSLSVPQLAAATAAAVLVASVGIITLRQNAAAPAPQVAEEQAGLSSTGIVRLSNDPTFQQYEQRINQLKQSVEQRMIAWNPELRMTYERNMLYVDQSLAECRQELNDDPADKDSQELMLNAYREKVRLLEGFSKF